MTIHHHEVVPGDTLSKIARDYNSTVDAIATANSWLADINLVKVGWVLHVPVVVTEPPAEEPPAEEPEEPPAEEPGQPVGEAGMKDRLGEFFVIGANQIPQIEQIETDLGRPVKYAMASLSVKHNNAPFDVAKGNAEALWTKPGHWQARRDVTVDCILPLVTVPFSDGHYATDAYTAEFVAAVAAGDHDADFSTIFEHAEGFRVQWRFGQEADIVQGNTAAKWAVDEDVWRDAWHRIQALGKSIDPAFRFIYLNNGGMWNTIAAHAGKAHPQHTNDQRQVWEYAYPDRADIIGMNTYTNRTRTITNALQNMRDLDALGRRFDKPVCISELGMHNLRADGTKINVSDAKAQTDWTAWMDELAKMTNLDHHTYYEGWSSTSLRQNWPAVYRDTFVPRMRD